jgi:hypothetical protein
MVSSGLLRRVALVRTDVSEEPGASFIRVTTIGELGTTQAATDVRCEEIPSISSQRTSVNSSSISSNSIIIFVTIHLNNPPTTNSRSGRIKATYTDGISIIPRAVTFTLSPLCKMTEANEPYPCFPYIHPEPPRNVLSIWIPKRKKT